MSASGSRELRVLGLFDHAGMGRDQRRERGAERIAGPYRVDLLAAHGIDLVTVPPARAALHLKLRDVAEHRSGVAQDLALRGARHAFRADAVLCLLEDKAVLPAALRRRRIPPYARPPIVAVSCWWAEEILHGSDEQRRRIARTARALDAIVVFSQNQAEAFARIGVADKVVPVPFGVDEAWYTPAEPVRPRLQVAAMGIDRGRDYLTLVDAARLTPEIRYDLFTQPERFAEIPLPPNVAVHAPVPMPAHRDNLRAADLVIVPTYDLAYPTGQSVLLEAMACGRCTAVTRTAAMAEYLDDGRSNLALPLHDPEGVARVVRRAIGDPGLRHRVGDAARAEVETRLTFDRTWARVAEVLREVAGRGERLR
ncbi:glycosyltransferase family 4 protein [Microbacterium azadirachtae]|uniref:D-inositol-3-phosphate glycosyltransferase n=1 Tax=Microbacterium azadirachtae TaxID=582680 RepID=A0A0F0LFU7_9MICO|nr:glycosyltransferase family 4 protein [Microbacterium azadirachtae]KJL31155.1 D-inositol-3-phosphate glycosyltransferase [Microbacterium azadirachtae]